ncbi:dihydrofolate reductase [Pararhizobium sp.]|uniref:dihydrofolate reductase n=1 Tax=Pararhizobium sp. TaxID=1977563 RepID=UPI003FA7C412
MVIVVAVAHGGVIGRDGDLPWRLPSDLKRFKAVTMGKPVIMGRKTYESIGRPLPGRPNIVISRSPELAIDGVAVVASLEAAISAGETAADSVGVDEVCVIGGGEIYRQAISVADILHVTEVDAEVEGDTRFPAIDPAVFERVFEEPIPRGEKDSHAMRFVTYRRKSLQT